MLIAEDLLLLLTNDETGKLVASAGEVDVALGGALLVELALMQRVDLAGPSEQVRKGRLVVRDASATSDPLLDEALAMAGGKQGKKPQNVVTALGKRVRVRLYDRLAGRGLLRAESGKVLGIFPRHHWPAQDATHEDSVRADLLTALRNAVAPDPRTGAMISLLLALHAVNKAVDPAATGLSRREMNASAKRIAEGDWASDAVRHAIDGMNAAVIAVSSSTGALAAAGDGRSSAAVIVRICTDHGAMPRSVSGTRCGRPTVAWKCTHSSAISPGGGARPRRPLPSAASPAPAAP